MTTPTNTFDLRTAKDLAADLIEQRACELNMDALDQLHGRIFTALGADDGPDAIAAKLTELGVKGALPEVIRDGGEIYGATEDDGQNALSVALREVCGADSAEISNYYGLICWTGRDGDELSHESVEAPAAVAAFLTKYEDFRYPELYNAPVPQEVITFQQDDRVGIERHEHIVRGPVREVTDRQGHSQPMPDDLVAAIGAAGLTAEDYGDVVLLGRDGVLWATVRGSDDNRFWMGQYGYRPDLHVMETYQGATSFDDRNDAVKYVIANVDTPRLLTEKLPDGRWQRGPLTSPARQVYVSDRILVAALAAGVTIDQPRHHTVGGFTLTRGDLVARVSLVGGSMWQYGLTGGQAQGSEKNLDAALLATIEALAAS